jgi:hypothetical protein
MKASKKSLITKIVMVFIFVLVVGLFSVPKIFHLGVAESIETNYGKPVPLRKGISVSSSAKGDVSDKDVDDLIDEYGTDSNIIILEVGK